MSGSNFVFPPPPPPPPPSSIATQSFSPEYPSANRGFRGGRGNTGGRGRGRGRGVNFSQVGQGNGRNAPSYSSHQYGHTGANHYGHSNASSSQGQDLAYGGQKRDFHKAFAPEKRVPARVAVAPAVPSFGSPLPTLQASPTVPKTTKTPAGPSKRTSNLLGLTPASVDQESSSEEDVDEEAKLAASLRSLDAVPGLQFTHKGQQLNLRSPAEIAAWIQERKRRYPTQARVKEALEKKAQSRTQAKEKAASDAINGKKPHLEKLHDRSRKTHTPKPNNKRSQQSTHKDSEIGKTPLAPLEAEGEAARARLKAQKLQKKLLRAQEEVKALEARELEPPQSSRAQGDNSARPTSVEQTSSKVDAESTKSDDVDYTSSDLSDSGLDTSEEDDTSSEESSSEDSNEEPPEVTSKVAPIDQVPSESPGPKPKRPCRYFMKSGRCKSGASCRFLHEKRDSQAPPTKARKVPQPSGRVSLYQRLLARQQEEEDKNHLSDNGLLDEPGGEKPVVVDDKMK